MTRVFIVLATLLCFAAPASAQKKANVALRVVDVSGGEAFLSAGTRKGLRVGTRVTFGNFERRVVRSTSSFAVVSARKLRVGQRGVARVERNREAEDHGLPKPRSAEAFAGVWPEAVLPATTQRPKPVPLGPMEREPSKVTGMLSATGVGVVPLDGETSSLARGELRARMAATPVENFPLSVFGDVAAQRWVGRYTTGISQGDDRPVLRVRELSMFLGAPDGLRAGAGRLRYAAVNLGPIDGARVEVGKTLRVSAFGGMLPDPIDGQAALSASRFGMEATLRGESDLRPELSVVVQGSSFDGRIDERRAFALAQIWPSTHRLSAYAEGQLFDADNPWNRNTTDLTGAGADVDLRFSKLRVGSRFDMRKPERSYWLANSFPSTWLCSSTSIADPNVPCLDADDTRYSLQAYGGLDFAHAQFDAGSAYTTSSQADLGSSLMGYATLRFPKIADRYDLAFGATQETSTLIFTSTSARVDFGVSMFEERVHLGLYYRPAYRLYQASTFGLIEHGGGMVMHVMPTDRLSLDLFGDTRIGDVNLAIVMMTMAYRFGG